MACFKLGRHTTDIKRFSKTISRLEIRSKCFVGFTLENVNKMKPLTQNNSLLVPVTIDYNDLQRLYSTHSGDLKSLLKHDIKDMYADIRQELEWQTNNAELLAIATYYLDGDGKALRPIMTILIARAVNYHINKDRLLPSQRVVAMLVEMIHSASLLHDDIVDCADIRRGKPSANITWNNKKVTMAGNFVLSIVFILMRRLKEENVNIILTRMTLEMIQGELMQLGSKETENKRFAHYLTKTYCKTASLIANSMKAVAILAGADENLIEIAFQYGRNTGLAFQLIDDLLDFVSTPDVMGKPIAADLKLGLATAPVLFASEEFPELNEMVIRRFQEAGDAERAFEMVHKSKGLEQTYFLVKKYCLEAVRLANSFRESPYQKELINLVDLIIDRVK